MHYFDSSALAKRYVRETGSAQVQRLLTSGPAATSRLSPAEIASALMRRFREGAFSAAERDRAFIALNADMAAILIVEITPGIVTRAQSLLQRHTLRASDAVQLASGLYLREELDDVRSFVSFDSRLAAAAGAEGLSVP